MARVMQLTQIFTHSVALKRFRKYLECRWYDHIRNGIATTCVGGQDRGLLYIIATVYRSPCLVEHANVLHRLSGSFVFYLLIYSYLRTYMFHMFRFFYRHFYFIFRLDPSKSSPAQTAFDDQHVI